ncbi:hypothetical protein RCL_jg19882.t1 [Rhizophagus clarus]|uniref:Uncharacterized protein n=1 Tax=Rhizophagus clarus TaxID=94130 RepID=A0A8H3L8J6_9GLOM|nr:hypothetical protein RCL_jg19882.t1 [Rhizophagus clarus]
MTQTFGNSIKEDPVGWVWSFPMINQGRRRSDNKEMKKSQYKKLSRRRCESKRPFCEEQQDEEQNEKDILIM